MNGKRVSQSQRYLAYKKGMHRRPCNLCNSDFIMRSPFDRFCGTCKSEKDLFKFAEWLPNLPMAI